MRLQCCMAARSSTVAGRMHTIFNMKSYLLNFRCETVLTQNFHLCPLDIAKIDLSGLGNACNADDPGTFFISLFLHV